MTEARRASTQRWPWGSAFGQPRGACWGQMSSQIAHRHLVSRSRLWGAVGSPSWAWAPAAGQVGGPS